MMRCMGVHIACITSGGRLSKRIIGAGRSWGRARASGGALRQGVCGEGGGAGGEGDAEGGRWMGMRGMVGAYIYGEEEEGGADGTLPRQTPSTAIQISPACRAGASPASNSARSYRSSSRGPALRPFRHALVAALFVVRGSTMRGWLRGRRDTSGTALVPRAPHGEPTRRCGAPALAAPESHPPFQRTVSAPLLLPPRTLLRTARRFPNSSN